MDGFAQTKKIANASHASDGLRFNWASSDNLGYIGDYEEFKPIKIKLPIDSNADVSFDTTEMEEPSPVDTAVYKEVSRSSVLVIEEATISATCERKKPKRTSEVIKRNKERREKKKRRKLGTLKSEIHELDKPNRKNTNKQTAGLGWLSLLLIIPAGMLVFKKS